MNMKKEYYDYKKVTRQRLDNFYRTISHHEKKRLLFPALWQPSKPHQSFPFFLYFNIQVYLCTKNASAVDTKNYKALVL